MSKRETKDMDIIADLFTGVDIMEKDYGRASSIINFLSVVLSNQVTANFLKEKPIKICETCSWYNVNSSTCNRYMTSESAGSFCSEWDDKFKEVTK